MLDLIYQLYFDRLHNEHFGTIKQQIYSARHFPLHIVLVLILQGASLLIIWLVALKGLEETDKRFRAIQVMKEEVFLRAAPNLLSRSDAASTSTFGTSFHKERTYPRNSSSGSRA
jgi:hypothetical protein